MFFSDHVYAIFLAVVFAGSWALGGFPRARRALLLGASWFFYGWWSWRFLGLILFSTVLDYLVGRALGRTDDPRRRRRLLQVSLVGNLGMLGFFKYWNFFAGELVANLERFGLSVGPVFTGVVLPVGISFYTFQTLSYTIDVHQRRIEPERSFLNLALFVAFFPQLVAGPIVRASSFLPQIRRAPRLDARGFESGLFLIFWGLVKKLCIGDFLGRTLVDPFWADPSSYGGVTSLLAIYGYAFQIYGDFSGYSDIAIGSARLLGFDLGENFRAPYRAASPRELWTRWHISLSSWLRDYLYVPLGGNRGGSLRTYRNLLLTMLLGGLWHGAAWMFVAWGAYHGLLLVADRLLGLPEPRGALGTWTRRLVTFQLVCLGWVLFRSPDLAAAMAVLSSLGSDAGTVAIPGIVLAALAFAVLTHLPGRATVDAFRERFFRLPGLLQGGVYALVLGLLMNASAGDRPFIYFQF